MSEYRNMWFKSKFSEFSAKIEYNFLDYFDEIERENMIDIKNPKCITCNNNIQILKLRINK